MLDENLARIVRLFADADVQFVLVGGLAMVLHGSAEITLDVDISYSRDKENLERLAQALGQHKARLRGVPEDLPFVLDARTFRNTQNLTLKTDVGGCRLARGS